MSQFLDDLVRIYVGEYPRHPDELDAEYLKRIKSELGIEFEGHKPINCEFKFDDIAEVK